MQEIGKDSLYPEEEQKRDTEIVDRLEKAYKEEPDSILKAEKYVYFYYFYEARRMKLLAMFFNEEIKRDPKDLLEEEEYYIFVDALLSSSSSCPVCAMDKHYAEKMWVSEMEKKLGKEDWKEMVKKTREDSKKALEEANKNTEKE